MAEQGFSVSWQVFVNGNDASDRMNPFVQEIECSGKSGGSADSARITFKDEGGECILPPKSTPVRIMIDGRLRFEGYTDAPECVIDRGGGMSLVVSCSGFDKKGKAKQGQRMSKDDCTLQEFLDEVAKKAGVSGVKVDQTLGKIKRKHWSTGGRSFLQLGQSLADELGGTFKLRGDRAVFAKRGDGSAPGGGSTPTIRATRGFNLIEARISPYEGRPRFSKARVRYYDRDEAKHKEKEIEIGGLDGGDVADLLGSSRSDESAAGDAAQGRKANSENEGGSGSVTILLDVEAEAEGTCIVEGVRAGVDGSYRIESWRDRITRSGGAETELQLKQPKGEAGSDNRKAGAE